MRISDWSSDVCSSDLTAAALKRLGFRPLEISHNYYDDLEARFDLPAELAARLRAENVLYDRDETGEYFQLYSPNFGEGFFFEIVQRRGGYRGYGGPNAPFRIAPQKRPILPQDRAGGVATGRAARREREGE